MTTPDIIKKARQEDLVIEITDWTITNHKKITQTEIKSLIRLIKRVGKQSLSLAYREGQKDRDREVCNHIVDGSNAVCFPINEDKPTIIFPMRILPNGFNFMSKKYLKEHPEFLDEVINKIKETKI